MQQIIKRLELIKTAISIDEEEIIELQTMKLNKLDIDDELKSILDKLNNLEYDSAMTDIQNYISKYSGIVEYKDPQIDELKLELKKLEETLQNLSQKNQEILNDIDKFNTVYSLRLGSIIQAILELKEKILYKKVQSKKEEQKQKQKTIDDIKEMIDEFEDILEQVDEYDENYDEITETYKELKEELENLENSINEDEEIYEKYEEAKQIHEEFNNEYEKAKDEFDDTLEISSENKKELKKLWKKACRLCHPDLVEDEIKSKANAIMKKLNEAYKLNDIDSIKEILESLENGYFELEFSSETIEDKEILRSKISEYKKQIKKLKKELQELEEDEIYQIIQEYDDLDIYFDELKIELENEKLSLEKNLGSIEKKVEETDDYWDEEF